MQGEATSQVQGSNREDNKEQQEVGQGQDWRSDCSMAP